MISHVFLDMDGVLADFHAAAVQLFDPQVNCGRNLTEVWENWPPGEWAIWKVLGISEAAFWYGVHNMGVSFWSSMIQPCSWMTGVLNLVKEEQVTVASCPSSHPSCVSGKVMWLRRHVGLPYMLGTEKHLLAGPGHVLIDDNVCNVAKWRLRGGSAILFPRPWNQRTRIAPDFSPLDYVREAFRNLQEGNHAPRTNPQGSGFRDSWSA